MKLLLLQPAARMNFLTDVSGLAMSTWLDEGYGYGIPVIIYGRRRGSTNVSEHTLPLFEKVLPFFRRREPCRASARHDPTGRSGSIYHYSLFLPYPCSRSWGDPIIRPYLQYATP